MRAFEKVSTIKSSYGDYEAVFHDDRLKLHQRLFQILKSPLAFWVFIFLLIFIFLKHYSQYHYYYIEQEHLFLYDTYYIYSEAFKPGGIAQILSDYLTQFFIVPNVGPLIMSLVYTSIGVLTAGIIKKSSPNSNLFIFSLITIITFLFVQFDTNYYYTGTIAYCIMLLSLFAFFHISSLYFRLVYSLLTAVLLFWITGPVAFLYVVCIFTWELFNRFSRAYVFMIPLLLIVSLSVWSVYSFFVIDYRFILLPDGYFNVRLQPGSVIYLSWITLLLIIILASFLQKRKQLGKIRKTVEHITIFIIICICTTLGFNKYVNFKSAIFEELDFYLRTAQWNKIIEQSEGDLNNYLYKFCLNIALAEEGKLADYMFSYDQYGPRGIYLDWNRVSHVSSLLSELYFSMGHISLSQRMAFESNVSTPGGGTNPRMMKRLIQTNIIFGSYLVADKYISLLEKTKYYKKWANSHRKFLWNDEAVEKDSLLQIKRKCILPVNHLAELDGLAADLKCIAEHNPAHKASIEYVGAIYLLSKEMHLFKELIEHYYGTDVLITLPKSFQEAVIILSEQDPTYWEKFNIPETTIRRYADYRKQVLANKGNQGLPGLLYRSYGDTYWFYYMFKNVK